MPSPPLSIEKFHFAGQFFAPEFCCTQQNKRKNGHSMHLFFMQLFVPGTSQISPDSTRETVFAAFSCGFLNRNVLGMEDYYVEF